VTLGVLAAVPITNKPTVLALVELMVPLVAVAALLALVVLLVGLIAPVMPLVALLAAVVLLVGLIALVMLLVGAVIPLVMLLVGAVIPLVALVVVCALATPGRPSSSAVTTGVILIAFMQRSSVSVVPWRSRSFIGPPT
jgi:hypothetical protein